MDFSKPFLSVALSLGTKLEAPPPTLAPEPGDHSIVSLVWLLKHPRPLTQLQLESAFKAAFKRAPSAVGSHGPSTLLKDGDWSYLIHQVSSPYVPDPAAAASAITDRRRKEILLNHRAWTSVDVFEKPVDGGDAYLRLGPLAAEVGDLSCLGLYCPEHQLLAPYEQALHYGLRTSEPLTVFQFQPDCEVVQVDAQDTDMRRAVLEARTKFPEFLQRHSRPKPGERFYVKAPFSDEHMWIDVRAVTGQSIQGSLANDPQSNPGLRIGTAVEVAASELTDWMIVVNGKPVLGHYTAQLLQ